MSNQLITETSPYLLQHADNPVDWHPWGADALRRARDADKPILLSIGYAACHWCHVMERESFEDAAIAARMNELFVCIKVDREERPDLDRIYQTAHQMLAQRPGGWPLTVALTPDGNAPFFAGTYFPPQPRMGMPGFGEVLDKVAAHYRRHRAQMDAHDRSFEQAMAQLNPTPLNLDADAALPQIAPTLAHAAAELATQFDPEHGGFGNAPKFPHPTQLELLLRHSHRARGDGDGDDNAKRSAQMFHLTLRRMAEGGLFDQLGGGFYRYSVDRRWAIPHFEKMLYDNAQLLALYSDALRCADHSRDRDFYRNIVERTAAWTMSEMQQAHGGYASTLDADSEGVEGQYYVWSETDLRALLRPAEYAAVEQFYGLVGEPNFDGNWHFAIRADTAAELAGGRDNAELQSAHATLLAARAQRIRPALDDKILTAWNGMMIKGMARASIALARDDFATSAQHALDFIRAELWRDDRLRVTSRGGEAKLNGYLDDYAFLAEGIVELLQAKWRERDLAFAVAICDAMLAHFEDRDHGGFFFTSHDHEKLLHRPKPGADDAIPSGNGAAARALCKLGHLLGEPRYLQSAERTLTLFADALRKTPSYHGSLCIALHARAPANQTVIIRGPATDFAKWQTACRQTYRAETAIFAIPNTATNLPPALAQRKANKRTVAYVCEGTKCSAVIENAGELAALLTRRDASCRTGGADTASGADGCADAACGGKGAGATDG
ncbi:MAG: thioredoxin domain-containing protein [bacterium]